MVSLFFVLSIYAFSPEFPFDPSMILAHATIAGIVAWLYTGGAVTALSHVALAFPQQHIKMYRICYQYDTKLCTLVSIIVGRFQCMAHGHARWNDITRKDHQMNIHDLRHDPIAWRILKERARALATQETTAATAEGEEILFFQLGDGRYGLPAPSIREVQPLGAWTALPATPSFVVGLVNIRGRLLAALDIRPLLDLPPAPPQATAQLIILAANGGDIGLLADAVLAVGRSDGHLTPVPSATTGRGAAWVRGVDRHLHVLLDPAALLADPRLIVNVASH